MTKKQSYIVLYILTELSGDSLPEVIGMCYVKQDPFI